MAPCSSDESSSPVSTKFNDNDPAPYSSSRTSPMAIELTITRQMKATIKDTKQLQQCDKSNNNRIEKLCEEEKFRAAIVNKLSSNITYTVIERMKFEKRSTRSFICEPTNITERKMKYAENKSEFRNR